MDEHEFLKEFLREIETIEPTESNEDINMWMSNYKDLEKNLKMEKAKRLLFFARYFDSTPLEVRDKYIEALLAILSLVPEDLKISTSATLKEKLIDITQSIDNPFQEKLRSALEKHVLA